MKHSPASAQLGRMPTLEVSQARFIAHGSWPGGLHNGGSRLGAEHFLGQQKVVLLGVCRFADPPVHPPRGFTRALKANALDSP